MLDTDQLSGRLMVTTADDPSPAKRPALIELKGDRFLCQRCRMINKRSAYSITKGLFYCPDCIALGRLTNQDYLLAFAEQNHFPKLVAPLSWQGKLTAAQAKIAQKLCQLENKQEDHLVWAVTGSGKTEMLFPVLQQAILKQERIAWVAPRIDVCNEIYPRLQQAFQAVSLQLMHGQNPHPYQYSQLLVCTIHQLLKFYRAFDLIILDECDSYPYVNNVMLHHALEQALKMDHCLLSLTATPSREYQKLMKQQLSYSVLNRRFHGQDLPVPKYCLITNVRFNKLNQRLQRIIKQLITQHQRFLLFVDSIKQAEQISNLLKIWLPNFQQTFVHAKDPKRQEKVQAFRKQKWSALVTTTVLERGVTFFDVDVLVWQADSKRFTMQSLIQIAGRAGRSIEHSDNQVWFFGETYNQNIVAAIQQIKRLNHG
ncbi:DEAD/DEAH box helicase family protein [Bombilactobacillus folatiphilus]|uniref:DEAD/DEAH box helicase family protein n=1 Tax=Bombilactobacillus folatiphilus TaxID=2923362 RepID=A0ABY4P845_9LACO|nr:DEAD/DEAH box helicase family protein [Bombilactobacillus folatiphilus]UQS81699.1 DEAD/DEAH box helicase family protein [Bombilactobacillus folatiphilus]